METNNNRKIFGFSKDFVILICLILFFVFFFPSVFSKINYLIERNHIYISSREKVEKAGGWKTVEQACLNFATNGFDAKDESVIYFFHGKRISTNSLPLVIDALQPMFLKKINDRNGVPIFQVILSCGHRTGTYDAPYYGIFVVCTNRMDYVPTFEFRFRGAQGLVERKGDLIFEAR